MIHAHILLIDADHRVLMIRDATGGWSFPGCAAPAGQHAVAALVAYGRDVYNVTTFDKALFPLTFAEADGALHMFYGCRNWVGLNNLQIIPQCMNTDDAAWVRVPRLGDYMLIEPVRAALPSLTTLLSGGM